MKLIRQSPENQSDNDLEPVELIDWYAQDESCTLQVGGTSVVVRFIGRKGRHVRIAVSATTGAKAVRSTEKPTRDEP